MWMAAFLKAEKVFIFILGARNSRKGQAPAKWWNYIHNWLGLPPARGRQLRVGWAPGSLLKGKRQADATASHAEPAWSVLSNSDGLVVKKKKKKNLPANVGDSGDLGSVCGSRRYPGGGNGNPLQYSCLEDSVGKRAWQATVQGAMELDTTEHTAHYIMGKVKKERTTPVSGVPDWFQDWWAGLQDQKE